MYVITVRFEIAPNHLAEFRKLMLSQAQNSLSQEDDCHQFDVCFDPDQSNVCFLYEKYTDRAAFDLHLASQHFRDFDAAVQPMIVKKDVNAWIETTADGDPA